MAKFLALSTLEKIFSQNLQATTSEIIELAKLQSLELVCAIGVDDIADAIADNSEAESLQDIVDGVASNDQVEYNLTPEQETEILTEYARYFDWSTCHADLYAAVVSVCEKST